jgi:hypothetical protein
MRNGKTEGKKPYVEQATSIGAGEGRRKENNCYNNEEPPRDYGLNNSQKGHVCLIDAMLGRITGDFFKGPGHVPGTRRKSVR